MNTVCFAALASLALCAVPPQTPLPLPRPEESVVKILAPTGCIADAQGSGVVVAPGIVATSAHVVQGAHEVKVLAMGKAYSPSAYILAPEWDLCLLRVPALPLPPVPMDEAQSLPTGTAVVAIGFPKGTGPISTRGSVTGQWTFRGSHLIQADTIIQHGNSGGGLFDAQGRLVGLNTFAILSYENLNFSLPVAWIQKMLQRPWQAGTSIALCRPNEAILQDFLEGIDEEPSNRKAWEAFNQVWVVARPQDPIAWFSLGYTLSQRASRLDLETPSPDASIREAARKAYLKAIALNPGYARAWNNLGAVQDELGNTQEALAAFRMAVKLKEDYALAWLNLGSACINARRLEEGARALEKGLRSIPDEAWGWTRLAYCELQLGRTDQAIHHQRVALRLCPMRVEWWLDLADYAHRAKRPEGYLEALDFLQRRLPAFAAEIDQRVRLAKL